MVDRGLSLSIPWFFFFAGVLPACAGFFAGVFPGVREPPGIPLDGGPNEGITGGRAGPRAANPNEGWPNERGEPPRFRTDRPGGKRSRADRSGEPKIITPISARPGAGPSSQWSFSSGFRRRRLDFFFGGSFGSRVLVRGGVVVGGMVGGRMGGGRSGGKTCVGVRIGVWVMIEIGVVSGTVVGVTSGMGTVTGVTAVSGVWVMIEIGVVSGTVVGVTSGMGTVTGVTAVSGA